MKKRIIISDTPNLGMGDAQIKVVVLGNYEPANETYAMQRLSPKDLEAIPDVMEKLKKVKSGNPTALWNMAVCFDCGISVERDLKKAKEYYMLAYTQEALDQGSFENVGKEEGSMTVINLIDTAQAYSDAALSECPCATYFLGMAYLNGLGVAENDIYAAFFFRTAANHGLAEALAALANSFFRGYGVEKDVQKAITLYKEASDAGCASATLILGQIYWNEGRREEGLHYIREAAKQGDTQAAEILKQIKY